MTTYQKIPGSGRRLHGPVAACISKLWLGPDHLLNIDQYGLFFTFHEKYRRFYYADIQGITVEESSTFRKITIIWSIALLVLLGVTWMFHSFQGLDGGSMAVFGVLLLPCAFLLGLNLWRGPSCKVMIHTAVQSELLPSVNRFKRAEKFMALIQPLIQQAQGILSEADTASLSAASATRSSAPAKFSAPPTLPEHVTRPRSVYFVALSLCLLLHAFCTGLLFFQPSTLGGAASTLMGIGVTIFWLVAMIQAARYRVSPQLRKFGWITLGYISLIYVISLSYYTFANLENPALSYNAMEWLRLIGERPVSQSIFLKFYNTLIVLGSGILGLTGLILQRSKNSAASPQPS